MADRQPATLRHAPEWKKGRTVSREVSTHNVCSPSCSSYDIVLGPEVEVVGLVVPPLVSVSGSVNDSFIHSIGNRARA